MDCRRGGGDLEEILTFSQVRRRDLWWGTVIEEYLLHLNVPRRSRPSKVLFLLMHRICSDKQGREDPNGPEHDLCEGEVWTAPTDCHRPPSSRRPRYVILLLPAHPTVPTPGSTISGHPGGLRGPDMLLAVRQCHGIDEQDLVSNMVNPEDRRLRRCDYLAV